MLTCFLRHEQARQLLTTARIRGPYTHDRPEIRVAADFSKETSNCRKAFLSLLPRLCQIDIKYGVFQLARMWITKGGNSQDFFDPEYLSLFLDELPT
ncbi:hypothetical protein NDU88_007653 [Pleurodeles waltl]|uniref:Uncharacterized protein n=1 Tax=Pleurodeles waltl TaxID=8319 RepID=A0AAV7U0Q5_PLEWA|nr:hypothetical protein NDU88_007653 [Pleurodeles waltl]